MAAEPDRIRVEESPITERIIQEAEKRPVIVEIKGHAYRVNAERIATSSPYTLESVYGSLPPLKGRKGSEMSNEELEAMIQAVKEENAKNVMDRMG